MDKFVKFPATIAEIVGVVILAVAAIAVAKKLPVLKTLV